MDYGPIKKELDGTQLWKAASDSKYTQGKGQVHKPCLSIHKTGE